MPLFTMLFPLELPPWTFSGVPKVVIAGGVGVGNMEP
jgi:hypothetical protein